MKKRNHWATWLTNRGLVVQNLKKLLANFTLKFLSRNMANTLIFFAKKVSSFLIFADSLIFFAKKVSSFLIFA